MKLSPFQAKSPGKSPCRALATVSLYAEDGYANSTLTGAGIAPSVRDCLSTEFGYDLHPERALRHGGFDVSAAGTVPPALAAAFEADDWEGAVRTAVCLGGDTDTLVCIAGAVAEAIHGVPAEIAMQARRHLTEDLQAVLERFAEKRSPSGH